jgi:hypothetical protein
MEEKSSLQKLAHLYFFGFLSYEKVNLWPGGKGVARKKHRREENSSRRSDRVSSERGGPSGRPAGRPNNGTTMFLGQEGLARPAREMINASWFFRATPLLPGLATPKISIHHPAFLPKS